MPRGENILGHDTFPWPSDIMESDAATSGAVRMLRRPIRLRASASNRAMASDPPEIPDDAGRRHFATTRWSLVLAAGASHRTDAQVALNELCETYWYPLYAYVRRRMWPMCMRRRT